MKNDEHQMTLGDLIKVLKALPADTGVASLTGPHSYRGYYTDLAFERGVGLMRAGALLAVVKRCVRRSFTGYKGGEFKMSRDTPVWVANYGCCGGMLIAIGKELTTKREV